LRKTSWVEAQEELRPFAKYSSVDGVCNSHRCRINFELRDFVYAIWGHLGYVRRVEGRLRGRPLGDEEAGFLEEMISDFARLYMLAGGHPVRIRGAVGMLDGIGWTKSISAEVGMGYVLIAEAKTVAFFPTQTDISSGLKKHIFYRIGRPSACSDCVLGYVQFTPYADPADVRRLMQFDLSCLTSWHRCKMQKDIMPAAWAEYLVEHPTSGVLPLATSCESWELEALGRDVENIGWGEIAKLGPVEPDESAHWVRIRAMERIKGNFEWESGKKYAIQAEWDGNGTVDDVKVGSRVFVLGGPFPHDGVWLDLDNACSIAPLNEENRKLIEQGILEVYVLQDEADWPWN
jgi:hypothetical protein